MGWQVAQSTGTMSVTSQASTQPIDGRRSCGPPGRNPKDDPGSSRASISVWQQQQQQQQQQQLIGLVSARGPRHNDTRCNAIELAQKQQGRNGTSDAAFVSVDLEAAVTKPRRTRADQVVGLSGRRSRTPQTPPQFPPATPAYGVA
ncbi:hypothetical protein GGTG_06946 [Gaeumannomyces tritici R3-111a-1]|uniref:Uncharacterized protein n=1 Tax=Gaeumannomyces tritici (strain R3-111a-1) TaxID=644352 RepID=J3P099_GAET3|nr:hypothetical protein GGTG_06946 [Gaeumannomyces tritici R3-111a-1]EJT77032.1 hypothetical protein GGTG_06946 [Gaeumannomyces tritici R3-111a-1]